MSKIVILSENLDGTTTDIMSWLYYLGKDVVRINSDDKKLQLIVIKNELIKIKTSYSTITIYPEDYVWARRAGIASIMVTTECSNSMLHQKIFKFQEQRDTWNSVYYWIINHCNFCENPFASNINKINVLDIACKEGLLVPEWIITSDKNELVAFVEKHKKVAAKPFNTLFYQENGYTIKSLTNCITKKNISAIPDFFDGLIFQKYIDKKYELRCFLFNNKLYTMAIFSQKDTKTRIDFRNYNHETPNRVAAFKLSSCYEKQLIRLSKRLNLFSGSFDILVDKYDNYYFLEVNPVGQFGMVSFPCNYYIEKDIALWLFQQTNYKIS